MRANFRLQRLFVDAPLKAGAQVEPPASQTHYLLHVLRMPDGAELLLFNGRDGEWLARARPDGKRRVMLDVVDCTRPQPERPDLEFLFAPLKVGRLDYLVQKATEMGAGRIRPVLTQHTQVHKLNTDRLRANVEEAAEQCGVLAVPVVDAPQRLETVLQGWDGARRLFFCDEGEETQNPVAALQAAGSGRHALLIGPEGGFSAAERTLLRALPFVTPIPLGPRILRADTAAVAALAVLQATIGDWR